MDLGRVVELSTNLVPWRLRHRVRQIPLLRSVQRLIVSRFLANRTFVHRINAGPAKGARFVITLPDDKLLWTGTWESGLATAISEAVKAGDICFDIGAYRGFFSAVMAIAGASMVYAFEPNPSNLSKLRALPALNPDLPLEILEVAVGNIDAKAEFIEMSEATMGRLSASAFESNPGSIAIYPVTVVRLDTLLEDGKLPRPNVVKIDVEGSELDVLRGAATLLRVARPRLFIEAHSSSLAIACTQFLSDFGYRVAVLQTDSGSDPAITREISHLDANAAE